jgi:DNA repair protein RadA/Sms
VIGWDGGRLSLRRAVLEARCGIAFGGLDVYLNVAGGVKVGEPAADLAVACAVLSSVSGVPAPADGAVFGEIGLSGEVRAVTQPDLRLKEAAKLGFASVLMPRRLRSANRKSAPPEGLSVREVGHVQDILTLFPASRGKEP